MRTDVGPCGMLCRANTGLLTKELRSACGAPGPYLCHSKMMLEPSELPCCVSQGTLAQQTESGHKQDQTSNQELYPWLWHHLPGPC